MAEDRAEVDDLQRLLSRVGASLDKFLKFEHPDALARREQVDGLLQVVLRIGAALVAEQS